MENHKKLTIIYRVCDATFGVHAKNRFFSNSKTEVSKRCFKSLYDSFSNYKKDVDFIVIADRASDELKSFFTLYPDVTVQHINLGGKTGLRDSIKQLFDLSQKIETDWIWQQEDDYLFTKDTAKNIFDILDNHKTICTTDYENLIIFPTDYSDRYTFKIDKKKRYYIFKGQYAYWREIQSTTFSWIHSRNFFQKNKDVYYKMFDHCKYKKFDKFVVDNLWSDPKTLVISPLPSLSVHLDNHISLPPFIDWQKIWNENA